MRDSLQAFGDDRVEALLLALQEGDVLETQAQDQVDGLLKGLGLGHRCGDCLRLLKQLRSNAYEPKVVIGR